MKMICENAGKCSDDDCPAKKAHNTLCSCSYSCLRSNGIKGSRCIPYIEPAKEPLTDHPKYCRLSMKPHKLCARATKADGDETCVYAGIGVTQFANIIATDWTICPRPGEQQPIELPKDPLKELVKEYYTIIHDMAKEGCGFREVFWEFTQKVRAL